MTPDEARSELLKLDGLVDRLGGYLGDGSPVPSYWPCGSCFENEGVYLYNTVRQKRPKVIVEVGRLFGCSTSHLALGCQHNQFGRVFSIDNNADTGQMIPPELRQFIDFINVDLFSLDGPSIERFAGGPIDLLLEDGPHTWGSTEHVLRNFPVAKGGTVIVHDYCHRTCQETVAAECQKVLGEPDEIFFEPPSDCGYAVYRR
ncbi:MAG TPA: class I SAM-dependent methyltransferase [Tepidisphaeraceae bacterium]|jgi:hypothetical protein|nr:class I SAM-dependent methyltransferase [Tepidisphaeraceae bacterium]